MFKKKIFKKLTVCVLAAALAVSAMACGSTGSSNTAVVDDNAQYSGKLEFDHNVEFTYAKNVTVEVYKGGYKMINIVDNNPILIVPENMAVPESIDSDVIVLQQPVTKMLISSTPTISLLNSIGCLDALSLTTTEKDSWYIDNVKAKMESGDVKYVGTDKEPDYELIAATGTNFAIFSSDISDDVATTLTQLGVSYVIDKSSLEDHPLARVEWAKVYGAMLNAEDAADAAFAEQEKLVNNISSTSAATGKTVAVFYITSSGGLYARNSDDYMTKMVKLAGGTYILDGQIGVGKTGTTKMEPEAFYEQAKDADVIIYIWTLGGKPSTLADFLARSTILEDMKAVKEGNVWCTTPDFFQTSSTIGNIISDINKVLSADSSSSVDSYTYLNRLK